MYYIFLFALICGHLPHLENEKKNNGIAFNSIVLLQFNNSPIGGKLPLISHCYKYCICSYSCVYVFLCDREQELLSQRVWILIATAKLLFSPSLFEKGSLYP